MFNPLVQDLSQLSEKDLVDKIEDLLKRISVMRFHPVNPQLQVLIHQYTAELNRRKESSASD
jgi:hypothetical protein